MIPAPEVIVRRILGKTLIMKKIIIDSGASCLLRAVGAKELLLQDVPPIDDDL